MLTLWEMMDVLQKQGICVSTLNNGFKFAETKQDDLPDNVIYMQSYWHIEVKDWATRCKEHKKNKEAFVKRLEKFRVELERKQRNENIRRSLVGGR